MRSFCRIFVVVFCCLMVFAASSSAQENFPTKPVQLIVPFAAGGSLDTINRLLAEKFRELLGQPVVVVNKPGANGAVGMQYVAMQKPDGYNIYAAAGAGAAYFNVVTPTFTQSLNDYVSTGAYANYPLIIIAHKDFPAKTMREVADYAKKHPKAVTYGTTGFGATGHILIELFKQRVGLTDADMPAVPYPGVAPAITAVVGNQAQIAIMALSAVVAKQLDAGAIKAIAITAPKRSSFRPEIPTIVEQGFPDLAINDYLSYWVPAKTPPAVVKKLEDTTRRAIEDKVVRQKIEDLYHEVEFLNGAEVRKLMDSRYNLLVPMIKKLNIQVQQ